jgi:hypothetical protein
MTFIGSFLHGEMHYVRLEKCNSKSDAICLPGIHHSSRQDQSTQSHKSARLMQSANKNSGKREYVKDTFLDTNILFKLQDTENFRQHLA